MNDCKNCRHAWRDEGEWVCARYAESCRPVCEDERAINTIIAYFFDYCGKRGRHFEPKGGA